MRDFLEHICTAPGAWLESIAPQSANNGRKSVEATADWLKAHRQDCFDHFWTGPDQLDNADFCDPIYDGFFDHDPWEPDITIEHVDPISSAVISSVSNIIISPSSNFGTSVPVAPPIPEDTCMTAVANNGEIPPLATIEPSESIFSPVGAFDVDVEGPLYKGLAISGSGEFGVDSGIQWQTDGSIPPSLNINYWSMVEHTATTVGTSSAIANVDNFRMTLMQSNAATPVTGGWEFAAGDIAFNLEAIVGGTGSSVQAFNSTPINVELVSGGVNNCPSSVATSCLATEGFSAEYNDAFGDSWVLDVEAMTWRP